MVLRDLKNIAGAVFLAFSVLMTLGCSDADDGKKAVVVLISERCDRYNASFDEKKVKEVKKGEEWSYELSGLCEGDPIWVNITVRKVGDEYRCSSRESGLGQHINGINPGDSYLLF